MKKGNISGLGGRLFQARLDYAARQGRKVSQEDVGLAVGVSQGTVAKWEKGKAEPTLAMVDKLAELLGVDRTYLAFGEAGDNPSSLTPQQQAALDAMEADFDEGLEELRSGRAIRVRTEDEVLEVEPPHQKEVARKEPGRRKRAG